MHEIETQPLSPNPPVKLCEVCGGPMEAVWQTGIDEVPGFWYVTCQRWTCLLWGFSFNSAPYPPSNLEGYLDVGRKRLATDMTTKLRRVKARIR